MGSTQLETSGPQEFVSKQPRPDLNRTSMCKAFLTLRPQVGETFSREVGFFRVVGKDGFFQKEKVFDGLCRWQDCYTDSKQELYIILRNW